MFSTRFRISLRSRYNPVQFIPNSSQRSRGKGPGTFEVLHSGKKFLLLISDTRALIVDQDLTKTQREDPSFCEVLTTIRRKSATGTWLFLLRYLRQNPTYKGYSSTRTCQKLQPLHASHPTC